MFSQTNQPEVTLEQYQEAEDILHARTTRQSNIANYYMCGVQKLFAMYKTCQENKFDDSTPCAKVTLALANIMHEQTALIEDNGEYRHEFPLREKSFELYEEVTQRYPDCKDPNVLAAALFNQADNARWGMNKECNYEESVVIYNSIINNPEVTDKNIIAWTKGRLGDSYQNGQGVERDTAKSAQLFQEIVDDADNISDKSIVAWAEFWVADAYENGYGREKDLAKAAQLFNQITKTYVTTDPIAVIYARERAENLEKQIYKADTKTHQ